MTGYRIRKRPTGTAREVAELRQRFKEYPGELAIPLGRALAELAGEYHAIGNLPVARRHMNASLRAARRALYDPEIDDGRRRTIVEFLLQSARLHHDQGNVPGCLADIDEALALDRATWDAHEYCLSSRELRHANILNWRARILGESGLEEEARALRAEAILMALSDPDYEEYGASTVVSSIANDLVFAHS